MVTAINVND